jgi:hypothetical protein
VYPKEKSLKKTMVLSMACLVVLALAGCSLMYDLIPSSDPLVGTWTVSQVSNGTSAFQSAATAGWVGTMIVKADGTWSEDFSVTPGGAISMSGTWIDSAQGVYTIVVAASTAPNYGSFVVTLSSDKKTMYSGGGSGISMQLTKN